jgi:hypothetical protein
MERKIIYTGNNFSFLLKLIPVLSKASKIIFHQLPYGPSLILWNLLSGYLPKSVWIIWGGDLYIYRESKSGFIEFFYEMLRKRIIRRIPEICCLIYGDYELSKTVYRHNAAFLQVMYPPPVDYLNYAPPAVNRKTRDTIKILIGNSGNPSNHHIDALLKLEDLKDEEILITCPLSYSGNPGYIDAVIGKGRELFGSKFVPVTSYLDPGKYLEMLWDTDIALMNHDRQQGLGNILPLLYFGKKVYMRGDTTSYRFLSGSGFMVYDILEVKMFSSEELRKYDDRMAQNRMIVGKLASEETTIRMWEKVLGAKSSK